VDGFGDEMKSNDLKKRITELEREVENLKNQLLTLSLRQNYIYVSTPVPQPVINPNPFVIPMQPTIICHQRNLGINHHPNMMI